MSADAFELVETVGADRLALKLAQVVAVAAEDAAHRVLFDHDRVGLGEELDGIVDVQIIFGAQGLRNYDAPQLIDFT